MWTTGLYSVFTFSNPNFFGNTIMAIRASTNVHWTGDLEEGGGGGLPGVQSAIAGASASAAATANAPAVTAVCLVACKFSPSRARVACSRLTMCPCKGFPMSHQIGTPGVKSYITNLI
uniref:Uncharacterized protein n=1 Tax=Oryza sativa subsp. japonica TaxID=39947 RepID=Q6K8L7_ORYSJ|nr:hypothetical protein [Oryza sativa Japonica Group]